MLPAWAQLATVATAVIMVSGTWVTARVTARSKAADLQHQLIDQVQEERDVKDRQLKEERAAFMAQLAEERRQNTEHVQAHARSLDRMWTDKAAGREYVARLRAQVWSRAEPPPELPPPGYIE